MSTDRRHLNVGGLTVEVVRKPIKNLHLGVYPPDGRVRVAAPLRVKDESVRLAIVDKLGWIKRQRVQFAAQLRQSTREMVNGESHWFMGRRLRLRVHERDAPPRVALRSMATLDLFVRPGAGVAQREAALANWYRQQLRARVPALLVRWQRRLGVQVSAWGIKRMKTKWGSYSANSRRIWLNLELAKKPERCLEYIIVHELAHCRYRRHDNEFMALLDRHLPTWREIRKTLNASPLGADKWIRR